MHAPTTMPHLRPRSRARSHHRSSMARPRHGGRCRCNRDRYSHRPPACLLVLRRPSSSLPAGLRVLSLRLLVVPLVIAIHRILLTSALVCTSLSISGASSRYHVVLLQLVCQQRPRLVDDHRLRERPGQACPAGMARLPRT